MALRDLQRKTWVHSGPSIINNHGLGVFDQPGANGSVAGSRKDSDNLKYKQKSDGTAKIHRNANSWMSNIQNDITAQLAALCQMP